MIGVSWRFFVIALFVTGCSSMCGQTRGDMTPEEVVEGYLDISLNMSEVEQRDALLEYTTGNLAEAIENAPPETIQAAYVDRRYNIVRYSVVERRDRTPVETEITFQLEYNDLGTKNAPVAEKSAATVTTENTVAVVKKKGVWYIRDVMGNKTSIDFPVSEESQIRATPGVLTCEGDECNEDP